MAKESKDEKDAKVEEREQYVPKTKFDELMERFEHQQRTIDTIQRQQVSRPGVAATPTSDIRSYSKVIAEEMGWEPDVTYANVVLIDRVLSTVSQQQLAPVLTGLYDRIDGLEAKVSLPDYPKFESEIEREREKYQASGRPLSRSEAYHMIRGRKLPELVEEAKKQAASEVQPNVTSTDGVGGSTSKVGPSGTSSTGLPSHDDLTRLTSEERKALLEQYQDTF